MTRDQIIAKLKWRKADIKAKGVVHLALFGSRMRGDHRADSDLDVLVDIDPALQRFSLIDLAGVKVRLDEILGLDTNIVERRTIKPGSRFAERISDDIIEVF
jgi:predicted nucleotidyltransferase